MPKFYTKYLHFVIFLQYQKKPKFLWVFSQNLPEKKVGLFIQNLLCIIIHSAILCAAAKYFFFVARRRACLYTWACRMLARLGAPAGEYINYSPAHIRVYKRGAVAKSRGCYAYFMPLFSRVARLAAFWRGCRVFYRTRGYRLILARLAASFVLFLIFGAFGGCRALPERQPRARCQSVNPERAAFLFVTILGAGAVAFVYGCGRVWRLSLQTRRKLFFLLFSSVFCGFLCASV